MPVAALGAGAAEQPPLNVILIVSDDQGYADYGFMGNPHVRTPHLDHMAAQSPKLDRFYVSPVCSPTRAALLTGRYPYRTGLMATNTGQSEMDPSEVTLAELLRAKGYFTGIYGKWHLGDHYPRRAQDQGFEETLVLRGGGLGQASDPPENDRRYTDPVLFHNGQMVRAQGYCTDVFFQAAREAIDRCQGENRPFFIYIAANAPHDPFHDVPEKPYQYYKSLGDSLRSFPTNSGDHPIAQQGEKNSADRLARIYAMVENLDENVGRLAQELDDRNLSSNTLVIYLSDNGPLGRRYMAGLRGEKGDVYEGGIRTPLLLSLPGTLSPATRVRVPLAHIDLVPTLLDACRVAPPDPGRFDGVNAWSLLTGRSAENTFPDRLLFIQSHRGNLPQLYHNATVIGREWKLTSNTHHLSPLSDGPPPLALFNLALDPNENTDVLAQHQPLARALAIAYENWFYEVTDRGFGPRITDIDPTKENPAVFTQQDRWIVRAGTWNSPAGEWRIRILRAGRYRFQPIVEKGGGWEHIELLIPEVNVTPFTLRPAVDSAVELELNLAPGIYTIQAKCFDKGRSRRLYQLSVAPANP